MMKEMYSQAEMIEVFRNAIEDRATWFKLVLDQVKAMGIEQEKIDQIAEKAIWEFGVMKGNKMGVCDTTDKLANKIYDGEVIGVFEMEKIKETEEHSTLEFSYCPLVESWKKLGADEEEVAKLCDYASCGDFGLASVSPALELTFDELISKGGKVCRMQIAKK